MLDASAAASAVIAVITSSVETIPSWERPSLVSLSMLACAFARARHFELRAGARGPRELRAEPPRADAGGGAHGERARGLLSPRAAVVAA